MEKVGGGFSYAMFALNSEDSTEEERTHGVKDENDAPSSEFNPLLTSPPTHGSGSENIDHNQPAGTNADESLDISESKPKKKGTASVMKKKTKKAKGTAKAPQKVKTEADDDAPESEDEESDNGPYCICRGPDDHRWMIQCDQCEDWFHGQCVKLDKEVGENLVEKFVCPNCTNPQLGLMTRYKKTCSLDRCKKPARIYNKKDWSVFCSAEHCTQWWDQQIARLPKRARDGGIPWDILTQEQLMALLESELAAFNGEDGKWRFDSRPFKSKKRTSDEASSQVDWDTILSSEERAILETSQRERATMLEEKQLCDSMIKLLDWALKRRQDLLEAKRIEKDTCGYDLCLDGVSAKHQFAAWKQTDAGIAVFSNQGLGEASAANMCDKRRCKTHQNWYSILKKSVAHQVKELESQLKVKLSREEAVKSAADERSLRKQREKNWAEILDDDEDETMSDA